MKSVVVITAPYDRGVHASEFKRRGWAPAALLPAPSTLPDTYATTDLQVSHDTYIQTVQQSVSPISLSKAAEELTSRHRVAAVVPGSARGVDLADRLAAILQLPGGAPVTSVIRRDRGLQARALAARQIPAPDLLRTTSRAVALTWARRQWAAAAAGEKPAALVVMAADTSVRAPVRLCRSAHALTAAWAEQRAAARQQAADDQLVIQPHLDGARYIVHTVSGQDMATGAVTHAITHIWAELSTKGRREGLFLLPTGGSWRVRHRRLSLYMVRALDALGMRSGAARSRVVDTPNRGPVLLGTRAFASRTPVDQALRELVGSDPVADVVRTAVAHGRVPDTWELTPPYLMRVPLRLPSTGRVDAGLWHKLTALPSLEQIIGPLAAGSTISGALDRLSQHTELVLAATTYQPLEQDREMVREIEQAGLYGAPAQAG